eukprot:768706-Hanusia_phi.AAC.9
MMGRGDERLRRRGGGGEAEERWRRGAEGLRELQALVAGGSLAGAAHEHEVALLQVERPDGA